MLIFRFSIDGRNGITGDKDASKILDTPHSSASSLRRMSTAAINFFNINNLKKKIKSTGKVGEKYTETQVAGGKNIKWEINDEPMDPSDNIDDDMFGKEFHYTSNRRGSIAEAFLVGSKPNTMNHVLEQTSVADFLRLLSSVETARVGENGKDLSSVSLFQAFSDGELSAKPNLTARRFSQVPTKLQQNLISRRYSQFSDNLASSVGSLVPRKRKFSHVPSLVGSLSSVAEDRNDYFTGNELILPRNELKQRKKTKDAPTFVVTPPEKNHRFNVTATGSQPTADNSKNSSRESLDEIVVRL